MTERGPRWLFSLIAGLVLASALWARLSYDINRSVDARSGEWVSLEPDSFYHMRRVQRLLSEGWPVAGSDPALDYPDGAEIPWPPYYTALLGVVATVVIEDSSSPAAWLKIERLVASMPVLFGCLGVLLAAWAARRIGGNGAAALAGLSSALALGPVVYGGIGNGDHHAFVSFLHVLLLLGLSEALQRDVFARPRPALAVGAALGIVLGIGLGSWVAFMAYLVEVELLLAWLLFRHTRQPLAGLAPFGLSLHLCALLTLTPALLGSPWQAVEPWSVVNLSAFHPFFLIVGAAVFVPLLLPRFAERPPRAYPWLVGGVLTLLFGLLFAIGIGPGEGLREAFSWASREDRFMASIHESTSVFDDLGKGLQQLQLSAGYLMWCLPLAWVAALVAARRGRLELLPWIVACPLLYLQALAQLRFAEALVLPAAVLVGWAWAALFARRAPTRRRVLVIALALLCGAATQVPATMEIARYRERAARAPEVTESQQRRGATRRLCEWLRDEPIIDGAEAVLASWGDGHMLEWVAGRPTIATNFGSYLGQSSYRFGPRAFLCEDDEHLEQLLEERQVGYIMLTSNMTEFLPDLISRDEPALFDELLMGQPEHWKGGLRPRWFGTALARLILAGSEPAAEWPAAAQLPFDFLRLVQVSPELDPAPHLRALVSRSPRAWIWQRVPGARLVFHGTQGSDIGLRLPLRYAGSDMRFSFESRARIGADGTGVLRVPYQTDTPNGNGRVQPGAIYWIGTGEQRLEIPSASVMQGSRLDLY